MIHPYKQRTCVFKLLRYLSLYYLQQRLIWNLWNTGSSLLIFNTVRLSIFISRCARCLALSFVFHFQPGKEVDFHVILSFCRSPSFEKYMLMHWKSLFCFIKRFLVEKAANSNIFLQNREQVSRVQIFMTNKNISILINRNYCALACCFCAKKRHYILRRHYSLVMTALGENIFRIGRSPTILLSKSKILPAFLWRKDLKFDLSQLLGHVVMTVFKPITSILSRHYHKLLNQKRPLDRDKKP